MCTPDRLSPSLNWVSLDARAIQLPTEDHLDFTILRCHLRLRLGGQVDEQGEPGRVRRAKDSSPRVTLLLSGGEVRAFEKIWEI